MRLPRLSRDLGAAAEFRRRRYLLVVDEVHHLPALADADPSGMAPGQVGGDVEASWSKAVLPLLELARVRLLRWAQRREVRVLVWTVDHPRIVRAALRDPRVWMVTTNRPAEAVAARERLSRA